MKTLLTHLDGQRRHVQEILEGLTEEDLRRPVLPSGWSCLGLVRHLTLDVERFWFQAVVAGDRATIDGLDRMGDAWQVGPDEPGASILDGYRRAVDAANAVITTASLDAEPAWWPERFDGWRLRTVREVVLHVMTETACHAGHLDAVRELIDGRKWLIMT